MKDLISIFNKYSLIFIAICLILCSCNNSFSVLKRKYRPEYSVSSNSSKVKLKKDPAENSTEIKTDPIADEKEIESFSSSIRNEPIILLNYNPEPIVIVCDTPPQKGAEEPRSLYKPKNPEDKRTPASNDRLEPISFLVLLNTIVIIVLGVTGYLVVIIPLVLFVLSLISVIRIKRNPKKFRKFSKILAIILLCLYSLFVLGLLIAGVIILSSV